MDCSDRSHIIYILRKKPTVSNLLPDTSHGTPLTVEFCGSKGDGRG